MNKPDYLAFFEEEIKWKEEINRRDFGKEILETMTYKETKKMLAPIMENRIDKKKFLDKKYRQINRIAKKYYAPDTFEFQFAVDAIWLLKFINDDIKNQDQLRNLERHWLYNESRKPRIKNSYQEPRKDFELSIAEAKNIAIEYLLSNPYKKSGVNTLVSLCPFHKEKTSSFTVFINTNTFYCFGCGAKGDSIAFYQKLYGASFIEAVKKLTGQY